ncbi:metallophosphoesterase, partial [Robiginitalea sp.]|uniref:metallophosphoesterase n=1 Tax=Robiginitalea sp. TaxID=1902411 RepID=UPI003C69A611
MKKPENKNSLFSFVQQRYIYSGIGFILAALAILAMFRDLVDPANYIGGLLLWAAILELLHGFKRAENHARNSAWISGGITLLIGIFLVNAQLFQNHPLVQIVSILLLTDALRSLYFYFKRKDHDNAKLNYLLPGLGNILIVVLILTFEGKGFAWVVALGGALRILGTVYNLFTAKLGNVKNVSKDIIEDLGVADNPGLVALTHKLEDEDEQRARVDLSWILIFILTLFFIHLGRMGFDRSKFGILSPVVAVIGDMFIALVVAYGIISPFRSLFKKLNSVFLKRSYNWAHKVPQSEWHFLSLRRPVNWWVEYQLDLSISMRKSSYSFSTAFRNGLKIGLPFAALLAAIMPVLGMSWYFDTENWASGIWDGFAGSRTEVWREAMVAANGEKIGPNAFRLQPEGLPASGDFSFVVIGDPGEGDASQLILKDQLLAVTNKPDISFMVISSDIVYPSGAMRDYERKFFLPFKGITKPIYAIPGNHDWYDALEGFTATFFTPQAAMRAMEARIESDHGLTLTDSDEVRELIAQASYLRKEYQMPTGHQNAPFFQVSTEEFVFLAIDTGVRRKVDNLQLEWLESVLKASKEKYVMALLGHPFYAIGEYQGD